MRDLPGARHLAPPELVEDPAGLFLGERILPGPLPPGQVTQRVARDAGIQRQRLERGDDRIPAEHGRVPGNASRDHLVSIDLHVQGPQVVRRAAEHDVELGQIGGPPAAGPAPPPIAPLEHGPPLIEPATQLAFPAAGRLVRQHVPLEGDGRVAGERELPTGRPGGEPVGRLAEPDHAFDHAPVATAIAKDEPVPRRLRGEELAPFLAAPPADLEDVGEVGAE